MQVTRALSRSSSASAASAASAASGAPDKGVAAPSMAAPEAAVSARTPVPNDVVQGARAGAVAQEAVWRDQLLNATPTPGSNKGWVIVRR